MYLAYALFCEGLSDHSYFEVLLPRVIESTVLKVGRVTVDVPERPAVRAQGELGSKSSPRLALPSSVRFKAPSFFEAPQSAARRTSAARRCIPFAET